MVHLVGCAMRTGPPRSGALPGTRLRIPRCARPKRPRTSYRAIAMNYLTLFLPLILLVIGCKVLAADEVLTVNGCRIEADSQCPNADLRNADLNNQDMRRMNLAGANLSGANLRHARLDLANLENASLQGANLTRASLQQSNLRLADFTDSTLVAIRGWGLFAQAAQFQNANMRAADLEFARLSGAKLHNVDLRAANLEMTWLSKADLKGASLIDANLQEVKLSGANLENADLSGTRRHYGNFQGANMQGCTACPLDWD